MTLRLSVSAYTQFTSLTGSSSTWHTWYHSFCHHWFHGPISQRCLHLTDPNLTCVTTPSSLALQIHSTRSQRPYGHADHPKRQHLSSPKSGRRVCLALAPAQSLHRAPGMQNLPVLRFCCGRGCCADRTGAAQQLRQRGFPHGEAIDTPAAPTTLQAFSWEDKTREKDRNTGKKRPSLSGEAAGRRAQELPARRHLGRGWDKPRQPRQGNNSGPGLPRDRESQRELERSDPSANSRHLEKM